MCDSACVEVKGQLTRSTCFPFGHMGSVNPSQVVRLGHRHSYPWSLFTGPDRIWLTHIGVWLPRIFQNHEMTLLCVIMQLARMSSFPSNSGIRPGRLWWVHSPEGGLHGLRLPCLSGSLRGNDTPLLWSVITSKGHESMQLKAQWSVWVGQGGHPCPSTVLYTCPHQKSKLKN